MKEKYKKANQNNDEIIEFKYIYDGHVINNKKI